MPHQKLGGLSIKINGDKDLKSLLIERTKFLKENSINGDRFYKECRKTQKSLAFGV